MQREQGLDQDIDQQVVPAMMLDLVCQREVARLAVDPRHEAGRQRDDGIEHPEGERGRRSRSLDQPDSAQRTGGGADLARAFEQFGAQREIG
ncbi:MAG: hypothetical protein V2J14_06195 [Erythrobacter sp.]|nr:hypothetical protein [Erythrobacter sp.]